MATLARWRHALKLGGWPKLLVPTALGQALGLRAATAWSWSAALAGALFSVCLLVFILLLNDWGDREVDALKRRMFPDRCSPKTIPDGILPSGQVLAVGLAAGLLGLGVAFGAGYALDRPALGPMALGCEAIFVGYTFPPLKLNYRGGGELLEALGVGAALPWLNAYLQGGVLWHGALALLGGFALMSLASALASGLSDEQSDRAGRKRTFTALFGNRATRRGVELALALGLLAWLGAAASFPELVPWWTMVPTAAVVACFGWRTLRASAAAATGAFAAQGTYKLELHRAIWYGAISLALLLMAARS